MFSIRNVGALLRGSATPFQIHVACWLGALLGFTPSMARAPALVLGLFALLVVLNANLFVAGLIGGLSHLASLATMPVAFALGRFLLDGPTRGFFTRVINAPVGAIALAIIDDMRVFMISPIAAQNAITRYRNIDIHAAGT